METENSFNEDKAIGNIGENAVRFLIETMPDWKCFKFGVENHIEALKEDIRKERNPITEKIKSMPDFVAFNNKTGKTFFIEAKYRSNPKKGNYLFNYLNKYNEYWPGTKLIIVRPNEPNFIYIDLDKITSKMKKSVEMSPGMWKEHWDFNSIEQNIRILFPDLSEEKIKTAIQKMIPNKKE